MAFALLTAARRLHPYFQGHPIMVRTSQPIRQALVDFVMELIPLVGRQIGEEEIWKVFVDGSSNAKGSRVRIIVESREGVSMEHSLNGPLTIKKSINLFLPSCFRLRKMERKKCMFPQIPSL
ncbi:hypothetical protein K1719_020439 [Acacia pycnantha]|nr:hypothetical protein K1719_020439 [Acacia pycnantha]